MDRGHGTEDTIMLHRSPPRTAFTHIRSTTNELAMGPTVPTAPVFLGGVRQGARRRDATASRKKALKACHSTWLPNRATNIGAKAQRRTVSDWCRFALTAASCT